MQKMRYFIHIILCLAVAVNCYGRVSDDKEEQLLNRLSRKLISTIKHNNAGNTPDNEKQYLIVDDENKGVFFPWFTSQGAGELWFKNYTPNGNTYNSLTRPAINDQILALKKSLLDPTQYKDYDIYFVVSGVYYAGNIDDDKKENELDWGNIKTKSFDKDVTNTINDAAHNGSADQQYVLNLTRKLLKKVQAGVEEDNVNFSSKFHYEQSKKMLIVFKWALFDISTQNIGGNSSYWASQNGITANIDGFLNQGTEYSMHVIDGIYYKTSGQSDIDGLLNYLNSGTNGDVIDYATTQARNDKMLRDITNTFLFFYQKGNNFLKDFCSKSADDKSTAISKVTPTYEIPTENGKSIRNPALYSSLSIDNRKCLLEYLLSQSYCTDASSMARPANSCENILLDVLASTPASQQRELLEFFNTPANYANLYKQLDDFGGGSNYTEAVFLLANMAESQQYSQAYDNNIEAYNFKWYQAEVGGSKVKNVSEVDAIIDKEKGIQFKVTSGFKTRFHNLPPIDFPPCSPFAQVNLAITDQIKYIVKPDGTPVKTGDIITVPAFFLHWVVNNQFKKEMATELRNLMLTISFTTGTGELFMANSVGARIWAAADLFFTTSSVIAENQDVRDYVQTKWGEDGIAALDVIDDLGTYVGVAYLTTGIASNIVSVVDNPSVISVLDEMATDPRVYPRLANIQKIREFFGPAIETDRLFRSVWNKRGFKGFRTLYLNDPEIRIFLQENSWAGKVQQWRDYYTFGPDKNVALFQQPNRGDLVVPSSKKYSQRMIDDKKKEIIPQEFIKNIDNAGERVFDCSRYHDSEVMGLEYDAKQRLKEKRLKPEKGHVYDDIEGELTITSDLCPCASCSRVIAQYRKMFPKVKLTIITSTRLNY